MATLKHFRARYWEAEAIENVGPQIYLIERLRTRVTQLKVLVRQPKFGLAPYEHRSGLREYSRLGSYGPILMLWV